MRAARCDARGMARVHPSEVEVDVSSPWRLVIVGALVFVACDPPAAPVAAPAGQEQRSDAGVAAPVAGKQGDAVAAAALPGFAPTTIGDTWTYQTGQTSPGVAMPGATSTDRIASGAQEGTRWVGRLVTEDAGNKAANSERSLIVTAAGVSPDIGTMTTSIGPVTTRTTSGVYLPTELTPGLRWSWTQALESPISTMEVAGSAEVIGTQRVTVPAGTFEAVVVRSEVKNHVVSKGGTIPPIDHVQRDESWYVRGLGLVKNVTQAGAGYRADKVLVRYSVHGAPSGQAPAQVATGAP